MTARATNVSVTDPVALAIEHVQNVLFRPFDIGRWFTIGFGAWLAGLGQRGFNLNFNNIGRQQHGATRQSPDFQEIFGKVRDFAMNNLSWIIPVILVLFLIGFTIGIVLLWLRCRGNFMFLHCVALNKAEIGVPWNKFASPADSLFLFRFVFGIIGTLSVLPLVGLMVLCFLRIFRYGPIASLGPWTAIRPIWPVIVLMLALFAVILVFGVIAKLTTDFVVPIMFLRGGRCLTAWSEFLHLLGANIGRFILYLLFQIV